MSTVLLVVIEASIELRKRLGQVALDVQAVGHRDGGDVGSRSWTVVASTRKSRDLNGDAGRHVVARPRDRAVDSAQELVASCTDGAQVAAGSEPSPCCRTAVKWPNVEDRVDGIGPPL